MTYSGGKKLKPLEGQMADDGLKIDNILPFLSKTTMEQIMKQMSKQPIFTVTDDAYERMLTSLKNGEPFVKTYISTCPHTKKSDCDCLYFKNILQDDYIVRIIDNEIKPVIPLSMLIRLKK